MVVNRRLRCYLLKLSRVSSQKFCLNRIYLRLIDASGEGSGDIYIRAGQFVMDNSTIAINTLDSKYGGHI